MIPLKQENVHPRWPRCHRVGHSLQDWTEKGLTSHQTHYESYRGWVFTGQMTQPTVSKQFKDPNILLTSVLSSNEVDLLRYST